MSKKKTLRKNSQTSSFGKNPMMKYALGLLLLTFLVFGNSIKNGYTYDDKPFISKNYIVQKGFSGIPTLMTTNFWEGYTLASSANPSYRPLPLVTLAIEYEFFGLNPKVNHFVNVLIYGLTVVVLFFLLQQFFNGKYLWLSLLMATLFCVHPIHTEVVANVKGRDDLLALFNGLMSVFLIFKYQNKEDKKYFIGSIIFFILALLSKSHIITFVAVIPLCLYFFTNLSLKKIGMQTLPFLMAGIGFLIIQSQVIGSISKIKTDYIDNPILAADSAVDAFATKVDVLGLYLQKMTIPHPLSCDYSYAAIQPTTMSDPMIYLWILIYGGLLFFAVKGLATKSLWSFSILLFFITIAPISNFLMNYVVAFAERAMYTPSLGFIFLLSLILYRGMEFLTDKKIFSVTLAKQISWGGLAILVAVFSFKSFTRNAVWENDISLFSTDIKTMPESVRLNVLYGRELINKNTGLKPVPINAELERVKSMAEKVLELNPKMQKGKLLLGNFYKTTGNYNQAEKLYLEANELGDNAMVNYNLGVLAGLKNKDQEAKKYFLKSLEIFPNYGHAMGNLGIIYGKENNLDKAVEYLEKSIQFSPDELNFYDMLAFAYQKKGDAVKSNFYKKLKNEIQNQ